MLLARRKTLCPSGAVHRHVAKKDEAAPAAGGTWERCCDRQSMIGENCKQAARPCSYPQSDDLISATPILLLGGKTVEQSIATSCYQTFLAAVP
jgi:hypothetical protein